MAEDSIRVRRSTFRKLKRYCEKTELARTVVVERAVDAYLKAQGRLHTGTDALSPNAQSTAPATGHKAKS